MWDFFQTAAKRLNDERKAMDSREALLVEQDYELASLAHAMKQRDQLEIERCKRRLTEIHQKLKVMP